MNESEGKVTDGEPITFDAAIRNAHRLLNTAEAETDRGLMERYEKLADSWIMIAQAISASTH